MDDKSLKEFNLEIDEFVKNIPKEAIAFQKKIVLEALRKLVMRTPVDTGRAKGNWQVSIGDPLIGKLETLDKEGQETVAKGLAAIADLPPYQVVWISNNLDYIELLEDGRSKQAPNGMLKLTVAELRQMFQ